jgi:hypothetical protein
MSLTGGAITEEDETSQSMSLFNPGRSQRDEYLKDKERMRRALLKKSSERVRNNHE